MSLTNPTTHGSHRSSQCPFNFPSQIKAIYNLVSRQPRPLCPDRYGQRLAFVSEQPIAPAISGLLFLCGPYAVAGLVVSIIVLAFNLVIEGRANAHVGEEVGEVVPSFADRNSTTTVAIKAGSGCNLTAMEHSSPATEGWRVSHAVGFAPSTGGIPAETAATSFSSSRYRLLQTVGRADRFVAAVAETSPQNQVVLISACELNHSKASESLAGQVSNAVVEFRKIGRFGRIDNSHEMHLSQEGRLWLEPASVSALVRLASLYLQTRKEVCPLCHAI